MVHAKTTRLGYSAMGGIRMLQNKFFWAAMSIVGIWLMVALVGIFTPGQPWVVPIAGIAMIPTILLVIFGFRGSQ
jgi:hypothetical protein